MKWWWVLMSINNRLVIKGPFNNDIKASMEAKAHGAQSFQLFELPTRNDAQASRMIRARRRELKSYGRAK